MDDNVIWIDSKWWFWTFVGLTLLVSMPSFWIKEYGPADHVVMTFGSAGVAIFLMIAMSWILSLFGLQLGMRG